MIPLENLGPSLQNILRVSYHNAEVTIDLRLTSNLPNILQIQGSSYGYDLLEIAFVK